MNGGVLYLELFKDWTSFGLSLEKPDFEWSAQVQPGLTLAKPEFQPKAREKNTVSCFPN